MSEFLENNRLRDYDEAVTRSAYDKIVKVAEEFTSDSDLWLNREAFGAAVIDILNETQELEFVGEDE